ncbi:MAG: response regulator transcription factor [Acidobacteria bacterium]|nr:response regulator transcription factor [Acidobacteriota bacterium]
MTSIVLADDHPIVRRGLRSVLEAEQGFTLIGEVGEGLEAVRMVESLQPDVLITDLMMPGLTGLEVTRQVKQRVPQTKVIILSMHATESYVLEALRNGANGYVLKDTVADELVRAIREVLVGRRYLSSQLSERAIESYVQKAESTAVDSYDSLTTREREVLKLAAEGLTNVEIAERLYISPRTAETHRANLLKKLNLSNHTELIRYAIRRGILSLDE